MKRLRSSDSLAGLMSVCPAAATEEDENREFNPLLDDDEEDEGCYGGTTSNNGHVVLRRLPSEKKRRLRTDQVKALERNFEVENKLEPERKARLAEELGLEPRQVAVWFQNRRARWKTKQLERDYGYLKANYDSLKGDFEALQQDNQALLQEIRELKSRLNDSDDHNNNHNNVNAKERNNLNPSSILVEEKPNPSESDTQPPFLPSPPIIPATSDHVMESAQQSLTILDFKDAVAATGPLPPPPSSDSSDSSALLNDENADGSPTCAAARSVLLTAASFSSRFNQGNPAVLASFVKMEEQEEYDEEVGFFSEEACNFYAEDQAPTLQQLYCTVDQWT